MPNNEALQNAVHLDKLNEELNDSLERCQDLVDDYRVKLAANSSEQCTVADKPEAG